MAPKPRRPDGGNGGDGPDPKKPSESSGSVDAGKSISGAQQTTEKFGTKGRPGSAASGQGTTPQGQTPTTTTPGVPRDRTGAQDLDSVPTSPDGALIDRVGDKSVEDYARERAATRAQELREIRERGETSAKEVGQVNAVVVDRRTGDVVEGVNGRRGEVIPEDRVHPVLRERLEQMRADGPYPQYNKDGTPMMRDGQQVMSEYPRNEDPLQHAEVKAVNELLWRRGADAPASTLGEFQMDTQFPFGQDGIRNAPCCANCNKLLEGAPNSSGRVTHAPGHPDHRFIPR